MADRSFGIRVTRAGSLTMSAAVLVLGLEACAGSAPVPSPSPLAQEQTPAPGVAPPQAYVPPVESSPSAAAIAPAAPAPQLSATSSPSPSADPADAQRAQEKQRLRSELAAAKAAADSLTTAANTECPDLKPGELRHPGAVSHCAGLRSRAAQAVSRYEALKKDARDAGIAVQ